MFFASARVSRQDRTLAIRAQADPPDGTNASTIFNAVQKHIESIALPPGYTLEWGGQHGSSSDANAGLASTTPIEFAPHRNLANLLVLFVVAGELNLNEDRSVVVVEELAMTCAHRARHIDFSLADA